jgi:hypothetical protein
VGGWIGGLELGTEAGAGLDWGCGDQRGLDVGGWRKMPGCLRDGVAGAWGEGGGMVSPLTASPLE